MQRKKIIFVSAFLCLLLSGCAKGETSRENSGGRVSASNTNLEKNSSGQPKTPRDSENVKFLYSKPLSEQPAVGIYSCEYSDVSEENYTALFSEKPECVKKTFAETKRRIHEYKTASESGIIAYTDNILQHISYSTEQGGNYMAVEDGSGAFNGTDEFDFISREKLTDKIKSIVRELFDVDVQVSIDAVTAERFAKDAAEHIKAAAELYGGTPNKNDYGAPADFYIVSFVQEIEGVPFDGGYGKAVYTSDGLESLYVNAPLKIGSEVAANGDFITLDGAEELLRKKYELLLLEEPESFIKAELVYAHLDNELIPVRRFISENGAETAFNAYTGKEIVWEIPGEGA